MSYSSLARSGSVSSASWAVLRIWSSSLIEPLVAAASSPWRTCLRSSVSRSECWAVWFQASSCSVSFFWSSSSWRAWSRISVISSENRFEALLAELLAQVVQLPAGPGALGEGLREPAFLECLGGLADVLAALLDLLACVGHPVAVLLVLHPLAELVGVAEDLLLLVAEPLELPLDLLARLLRSWPPRGPIAAP